MSLQSKESNCTELPLRLTPARKQLFTAGHAVGAGFELLIDLMRQSRKKMGVFSLYGMKDVLEVTHGGIKTFFGAGIDQIGSTSDCRRFSRSTGMVELMPTT